VSLRGFADARLRDARFERILLIKPSALGDVIHTLPILVKLRARYPAARIDWLLVPAIADLIQHHPALSNVVLFDRQRYARLSAPYTAGSGLLRLLQELREGQYDLVVDLHGQIRSAVFTAVTGARTRIGFDRPRAAVRAGPRKLPRAAYRHGWTGAREGSWLVYTHRIPIPTLEAHAVDRYLRLGPILGLDEAPPDFHVPVPTHARLEMAALLGQHGLEARPFAVLAPGTVWETKHWRGEGFAALAQHFAKRGWGVVLVGSSRERARCAAVKAACSAALDVCGRTSVSQLAALIERAQIAVTNDSGPMHLAVALDRPVVSIFGPTDAVWIGPYLRPDAVVSAGVPCAPCYLRRLRECPHEHACMQQVSAESVIERAERMLRSGMLSRAAGKHAAWLPG
jgi:lipopolysaccharide heptosyltransferase I